MNKINLEKLKKCDQVWEDMTPNEQGRICTKCQNTIIDFRALTDKEVAEIHMFSEGRVCGLYRKDQLQIKPPKKRYSRFASEIVAILGMLTTVDLSGQSTFNNAPVELHESPHSDVSLIKRKQSSDNDLKEEDKSIYGRMKDENGEPLIGATVLIKGTRKGTVSNINGYYRLEIGDHLSDTNHLVLIYSYTGFETQEFVIYSGAVANQERIKVDISFEEAAESLTSFSIVGTRKRGIHRRVWWHIKNIFTKK